MWHEHLLSDPCQDLPSIAKGGQAMPRLGMAWEEQGCCLGGPHVDAGEGRAGHFWALRVTRRQGGWSPLSCSLCSVPNYSFLGHSNKRRTGNFLKATRSCITEFLLIWISVVVLCHVYIRQH
jgi:hypothetical protein